MIFKTRNNGSIGRDEVIKIVGDAVRKQEGDSSVDLKSPNVAIIVEVSEKNTLADFTLKYLSSGRESCVLHWCGPQLLCQEEVQPGGACEA